jgi:hypothetical protein
MNPILYGAHKASLYYCSSDGYMGNIAASNATWGFHFRGQKLIRAMLKDLQKKYNLAAAQQVVFAGESAGGRGVMTNIDNLVQSSDNLLPSTAKVVAWIDSPLYVVLSPPVLPEVSAAGFPGFEVTEKLKYQSFNTTGIIPPDCEKAYATTPWYCQLGEFRMQFVKTPFFLVGSMADAYQLNSDTDQGNPKHYDASAMQFASDFSALTNKTVNTLISYFSSSTDSSTESSDSGEDSLESPHGSSSSKSSEARADSDSERAPADTLPLARPRIMSARQSYTGDDGDAVETTRRRSTSQSSATVVAKPLRQKLSTNRVRVKRKFFTDDRPPFLLEVDENTDTDIAAVVNDWTVPEKLEMSNISVSVLINYITFV